MKRMHHRQQKRAGRKISLHFCIHFNRRKLHFRHRHFREGRGLNNSEREMFHVVQNHAYLITLFAGNQPRSFLHWKYHRVRVILTNLLLNQPHLFIFDIVCKVAVMITSASKFFMVIERYCFPRSVVEHSISTLEYTCAYLTEPPFAPSSKLHMGKREGIRGPGKEKLPTIEIAQIYILIFLDSESVKLR